MHWVILQVKGNSDVIAFFHDSKEILETAWPPNRYIIPGILEPKEVGNGIVQNKNVTQLVDVNVSSKASSTVSFATF